VPKRAAAVIVWAMLEMTFSLTVTAENGAHRARGGPLQQSAGDLRDSPRRGLREQPRVAAAGGSHQQSKLPSQYGSLKAL
jgi:hypothetical protein